MHAFVTVVVTLDTGFVYIIICIFFNSPPGSARKLLEAHRRDHGDRVLSGPPGEVMKVHEKTRNREGNPQEMHEYVESRDCGAKLRN